MSTRKAELRLKLQLENLSDLINEQNRMVLAQIEPTESDRQEVMHVLTDTRALLAGQGIDACKYEAAYTGILDELQNLSYNIDSALKFPILTEETASPETADSGELSNSTPDLYELNDPRKKSKHVRFADDDGTPANELYDQNNELIYDQDRRLEELSQNVGRQHVIGQDIYSEVETQNQLLNDFEESVDGSNQLLTRAANGVRNFNRKNREYGVCSLIFLLVIVLFILLII